MHQTIPQPDSHAAWIADRSAEERAARREAVRSLLSRQRQFWVRCSTATITVVLLCGFAGCLQ